jgi:hypothetical protein
MLRTRIVWEFAQKADELAQMQQKWHSIVTHQFGLRLEIPIIFILYIYVDLFYSEWEIIKRAKLPRDIDK